jgi:hypothetical protein
VCGIPGEFVVAAGAEDLRIVGGQLLGWIAEETSTIVAAVVEQRSISLLSSPLSLSISRSLSYLSISRSLAPGDLSLYLSRCSLSIISL